MFKLKKFISMVLCAVLLLSVLSTAQAAEMETSSKDLEEYITFTSGLERIEPDGTFEFNIRAELKSKNFTADDDTITIYSKCRRFNVNTGSVTSSTSYEYTLTLYEYETGDVIGSYTGYANNKKTTQKFSVEEGKEYYFIITCDPTHTTPYSLKGTGKVSNVTVE